MSNLKSGYVCTSHVVIFFPGETVIVENTVIVTIMIGSSCFVELVGTY
jgi:hypothetical protein